jgi:hypothetical protein
MIHSYFRAHAHKKAPRARRAKEPDSPKEQKDQQQNRNRNADQPKQNVTHGQNPSRIDINTLD